MQKHQIAAGFNGLWECLVVCFTIGCSINHQRAVDAWICTRKA